jgi:hypothetical protein
LAIVPSSGRSSSLVYGRDAQAFNSMYLLLGFFKDGKKTFTGYLEASDPINHNLWIADVQHLPFGASTNPLSEHPQVDTPGSRREEAIKLG